MAADLMRYSLNTREIVTNAHHQSLLRRAIDLELGGWRSLYRWVSRRPRVPDGAKAFAYTGPVRTVLLLFIVLSAVEIVIVDLLVRQWPAVRVTALAVGVWGLLFMLGYLAGLAVHPHAVGPEGIHVRFGVSLDVTLPWDAVARVGQRRRGLLDSKTFQVTAETAGSALHVALQSTTNVDVVLHRPVTVSLPNGQEVVTAVRLWADDPAGFVARAESHRPAPPPRRPGRGPRS